MVKINQALVFNNQPPGTGGSGGENGSGFKYRAGDANPLHGGAGFGFHSYGAAGATAHGAGHEFFHRYLAG